MGVIISLSPGATEIVPAAQRALMILAAREMRVGLDLPVLRSPILQAIAIYNIQIRGEGLIYALTVPVISQLRGRYWWDNATL